MSVARIGVKAPPELPKPGPGAKPAESASGVATTIRNNRMRLTGCGFRPAVQVAILVTRRAKRRYTGNPFLLP
jgi:hypothetical protein